MDRVKNALSKVNNRPNVSGKYDYGKLLIVAGKPSMMGAAIMAAKVAFRAGVGLVVVSCDPSQHPVIHNAVPEAMCVGRNIKTSELVKYSAVAFGPAAGKDDEAASLLYKIMNEYNGPLVLDADGLTILAENKSIADNHKCKLILTPHEREAARLLDCKADAVINNRERAAQVMYEKYGASATLVKGYESKICVGEEVLTNQTGNSGMATAGSGDVLTGIVGAFAAQGVDPKDALVAGAYVHGKAGDLAAEKYGKASLMATDIIEFLPSVLKEV